MKTSKFIINILRLLLLFTVGLFFSCEKYVDIKNKSSISIIETAKDCQLILNDYSNMNIGYPSDGLASTDDYYLSDAGYLKTSLTSTDRDLYIWSPRAIRDLALPQWQTPYHVVYNSNLVLENLLKLSGTTDESVIDDLRGQALFFRAYSFWQIAQIYCKPYLSSSAGQDLGIPLRLSSDINEKSLRNTVQGTYDQILNDLNEATKKLKTTSIVASRPNKVAAYALLARVYLSMDDYTNALINANLALQINNQLIDFNTISTISSTPFTRFNKEVIFQSVLSRDPSLEPGSATSNTGKIDQQLVASYSSNDLRKQIFIKPNTGVDIGTYRFSGNYEPATTAAFFNGLAVDELYLIQAECYARSGKISESMLSLNTLLRTRWITGTYTEMAALSADSALALVLIERRKELLMRGQRWTDLRRLNHDSRFSKILTRTVAGTTYTLLPNDVRYTLLIPDEVIRNAGLEQNER